MSLPGFTADIALDDRCDEYIGRIKHGDLQRRKDDCVYLAGCECDWWNWFLDPIGCTAKRSLARGNPLSAGIPPMGPSTYSTPRVPADEVLANVDHHLVPELLACGIR